MTLTPEQELEIAQIKVNYFKVCRHFGLSDTEALNPNCGDWLVDVIKQAETGLTLMRSMLLKKNANQTVENYKESVPFKPQASSSQLDLPPLSPEGKADEKTHL